VGRGLPDPRLPRVSRHPPRLIQFIALYNAQNAQRGATPWDAWGGSGCDHALGSSTERFVERTHPHTIATDQTRYAKLRRAAAAG
jgi:hypothetical protein